jgi:fructose-1,6-bisphosphatase II
MLYIGERVGRWADGDLEVEIAVDPLEGTNLCATGKKDARKEIERFRCQYYHKS